MAARVDGEGAGHVRVDVAVVVVRACLRRRELVRRADRPGQRVLLVEGLRARLIDGEVHVVRHRVLVLEVHGDGGTGRDLQLLGRVGDVLGDDRLGRRAGLAFLGTLPDAVGGQASAREQHGEHGADAHEGAGRHLGSVGDEEAAGEDGNGGEDGDDHRDVVVDGEQHP